MLVPVVTAPVPAALELTIHVTEVSGLLVPVTVALNCSVLPAVTDCPAGLTVTFVTVGVAGVTGVAGVAGGRAGLCSVTFTVTLPVFEVSAIEVART